MAIARPGGGSQEFKLKIGGDHVSKMTKYDSNADPRTNTRRPPADNPSETIQPTLGSVVPRRGWPVSPSDDGQIL